MSNKVPLLCVYMYLTTSDKKHSFNGSAILDKSLK